MISDERKQEIIDDTNLKISIMFLQEFNRFLDKNLEEYDSRDDFIKKFSPKLNLFIKNRKIFYQKQFKKLFRQEILDEKSHIVKIGKYTAETRFSQTELIKKKKPEIKLKMLGFCQHCGKLFWSNRESLPSRLKSQLVHFDAEKFLRELLTTESPTRKPLQKYCPGRKCRDAAYYQNKKKRIKKKRRKLKICSVCGNLHYRKSDNCGKSRCKQISKIRKEINQPDVSQ